MAKRPFDPTTAVLGLYSYAEFAALVAVFLPLMRRAYYAHRDDPTQRVPGQWMRRFGRTASKLSPIWKFSVEGDRPADIDTTAYVVVANHESTADPFLLTYLPWDMRWVAKEEIFKLPILGKMMTYGGDIPLRRGEKGSVLEMLAECRRTLDHGMSIMMFPEGTRSKDGDLLPFKAGAFQLAIEAGVKILPLAISGTRDCRPKGSKWFGKARAIVKVLPPIETAGLTVADAQALADKTRGVIADALPELRTRTGLGGR